MTSRDVLLKGGESGPAIVPGEPAKSRLIQGIHYTNDELKMPPKGKLKAGEIAILETWVKDGAVWPDAKTTKTEAVSPGQLFTDEQKKFWSFQPLRTHKLPTVRDSEWPQTPIDAFILARLEEKNLRPAKPADKYTLLRRVTFDLTGLPPTVAEIEAFLADSSPIAFETVIDRLLGSPAYGERWGRHWLDIARYADSNGLDENTAFGNAWRYRDYVIRSFNADKPYDRFIREQIAGDLLPDASTNIDALTGTGFLVLGPKLLAEPDKQKMKMDIADEQLDTLGKAMLGLTLGCARCHDHKFDPIPQRDYYSLLANFTSTRTMKSLATVANAFERPLPTQEPPQRAQARAKKLAEKEQEIQRLTETLRAKILADARDNLAAYLLATADARGRAGVARMNGGLVTGAIVLEAEKYKSGTADKSTTGYGEGIGIVLSYKTENKRAEYSINVPKDGEYELELRYAALQSRPIRISLGGKTILPNAASGTSGGWNPENQAWKPEGRITLVKGNNTLAIEAHELLPHIDKLAILPVEPVASTISERPSAGTIVEVARQRKLIPEFVVGWSDYLRTSNDPLFAVWKELSKFPDPEITKQAERILARYRQTGPPPDDLNQYAQRLSKAIMSAETAKKVLTDPNGPFSLKTPLPANPELFYPQELSAISQANTEYAAIQKTAPAVINVLSVEDGAKYEQVTGDGKPRNLFVQIRGNYLSPGEEAPAVFPRILTGETQSTFVSTQGELPKAEANQIRYGGVRSASGRLELANWIASPSNPLTARVLVNRIWQHHFGEGIVRSPDNFGQLGERPSHPELLDYLATRFIETGWSIKTLHKLILLSATYQLQADSEGGPSSLDPENRLLRNQNRVRLEAEPIRDSLLDVAGNIDRRMGGTLLSNGNFSYVNNENSTNTARYDNQRRSVYLPVIRNTLFDFFQTFDFAEPHVSNGKRASTVVTPQALFMLNSSFVKDQSKVFADSLLAMQGDDSDRIRRGYLRAYGRPATSKEIANAIAFVARVGSAEAGTESVESKRRVKAWQALCHVLFASSEFIYVN